MLRRSRLGAPQAMRARTRPPRGNARPSASANPTPSHPPPLSLPSPFTPTPTHAYPPPGMFAFSGMAPEMVDALASQHSIYMTRNGRISMAGMNSGNVARLAEAVHAVTK